MRRFNEPRVAFGRLKSGSLPSLPRNPAAPHLGRIAEPPDSSVILV